MLLYEVTVRVDPEIAEAFLAWLRAHVDEMKTLPPIDDARMFRSTDEEDEHVVFVSQYEMASRAAYEDYLQNYAERMRGDGTKRFGGRFTASRRVLERIDAD